MEITPLQLQDKDEMASGKYTRVKVDRINLIPISKIPVFVFHNFLFHVALLFFGEQKSFGRRLSQALKSEVRTHLEMINRIYFSGQVWDSTIDHTIDNTYDICEQGKNPFFYKRQSETQTRYYEFAI